MSSRRVVPTVTGALTTAAVVLATLVAVTAPAAPAAAVAAPRDGSAAAAAAAASCWEIKTNNPAAQDGTYWLLTPAMDAPAQFYCDMTTDGGGWVLIGKGREGWSSHYEGNGTQSALRTAGLSPMSGLTSQYSSKIIDGLLNGGGPDALADGIRLRRATNAAGTQWQESRFTTDKADRWVWTFGAEHKVAWYSFDGIRGTGGLTSSFGVDDAYQRINTNTSEAKEQGNTIGFSFGKNVTGTSSSTSYLWSATDGLGSARPYTEAYLRPQVRSVDAGFVRIRATGTAAKTNTAVAASLAADSPWGPAGYRLGSAAPTANQPPVAAFSASTMDLGVAVDGSGSTDPDGSVASWAWTFGDGGTAQGATATHTYAAAGSYPLTLTVTDDQGSAATKTTLVTVTAVPPPVNQAPVAAFRATVKDLGVTVDGSGSADPDGTVAAWAWDFGAGGTAAGVSAAHAYAAPGTYTMTLTVTDDKGATGLKKIPVTATAAPDTVLVAAKSSWAWRYDAVAPAAAWTNPGFDASGWKSGNAVLGSGSTGLGTNIDVVNTPTGRPLAAYFLRQFTVNPAAGVQKLRLSTVADDGVVVYVNGTEVGRSNMPAGTIGPGTYALTSVGTPVANLGPVTIDMPVSPLVNGTKTIAVETHVNYRATKDLSFDLTAAVSLG